MYSSFRYVLHSDKCVSEMLHAGFSASLKNPVSFNLIAVCGDSIPHSQLACTRGLQKKKVAFFSRTRNQQTVPLLQCGRKLPRHLGSLPTKLHHHLSPFYHQSHSSSFALYTPLPRSFFFYFIIHSKLIASNLTTSLLLYLSSFRS